MDFWKCPFFFWCDGQHIVSWSSRHASTYWLHPKAYPMPTGLCPFNNRRSTLRCSLLASSACLVALVAAHFHRLIQYQDFTPDVDERQTGAQFLKTQAQVHSARRWFRATGSSSAQHAVYIKDFRSVESMGEFPRQHILLETGAKQVKYFVVW